MAYPRKLIFLISLIFCIFFIPISNEAGTGDGPRRIVSLYPGHTDNIIALGRGDRLVAVSSSETDWGAGVIIPQKVATLPQKVGAEAVLALKPDAVFMRSLVERMNPHLSQVLERAGVAVHVIDPPSWEEFEEYLTRLAAILGTSPEAAREKLAVLRKSIAQAAETSARGKSKQAVFLEATSKELHTCAPGSWAARLMELAGGVNAAALAVPLRKGSSIAPWGIERVLQAADSGLDVYLVQQGAMNAASLDEVRKRPWFAALAGHLRLAAVPESCLSRPSLLGLEKGGKMLVEIFYGDSRNDD
ncbi:MAG: ABC transporter substrate-binding protein [Synergistaceae bacterium]|jgi:iron complex transport system substrate-binding protein|nr:ABC transporter substrate-binding protein [Synergistaceae bacterium]